jgi:hypothetical protein
MDTMPAVQLDDAFYRRVKQGVLQFVFLRPMVSVLALILAGWDRYEEGDFSLSSGYLYCSLVTNTSVSVSLYYLVLLYTVTKDHLHPSVLYKFLCVKSLVFFAYWQSCFFAVFLRLGLFGKGTAAPQASVVYQNVLMAVELAAASYCIWQAFSFMEFHSRQKRSYSVIKSVGDVLNMKDLIADAQSTFASTQESLDFDSYSWD